MARDLSTAVADAIVAEQVTRTLAVELDYDSGTVYLAGAPFNISFTPVGGGGAQTFLGVGALGQVSVIEEGSDVQAYTVTLSLAGVPRDAIAAAITEQYQGRPATIYEVVLDPATEALIADPIVIFRGHMDVQTIELTAQDAVVSVTVVNRLADWERARYHYYTDTEQQALHPGDTGLRFVGSMQNIDVVWPNANWFQDPKGAAKVVAGITTLFS